MEADVRMYEPLSDSKRLVIEVAQGNQKRDLRKPSTSNGLYTLLGVVQLSA